MEPILSLVIPCFNHGQYLREALDSIPNPNDQNLEIIIVNDGSTDSFTLKTLNDLNEEGFTIIHQENQGLGKTRNNGIKLAKGKYILPLDADNKLLPSIIKKGIEYLETHPEVAVFYTDLEYFGDRFGLVSVPDFNLQQLITGNYIDACAIYRKASWTQVKGYDENMPYMGVEDWEFWLNLSFHGYKFYHFPEAGFYYRVINNSMIHKDTAPNFQILRNYIEKKHSYYINYNAPANYFSEKFKASPLVFIFKLILKSYFPEIYQNWIRQGKIKRF